MSVSLCLVWTSGNLAQAAMLAPDVFAAPSNLPQFQLAPPGQLGRISEYFNAAGEAKLVILIQDLHAHYGVQKNIAGLLEYLSDRLKKSSPRQFVSRGPATLTSTPLDPRFQSAGMTQKEIPFTLAVEGAEGPIDSSVMALFPDEKIKLAAADYLMREGELSGAEYFAIQRRQPNLLVGVEEAGYYTVHRELFRKTFQDREKLTHALKAIQTEVAELPRYVFRKNKALWDFHKKVESYDKAEMSTHEFITHVVIPAAVDVKKDFPTLASFASNAHFGTMDQVRSETAQFLSNIQGHLSPEEKANLKLLAKNQGNSAYYLYVRDLIYQKNLYLAVPLELGQYLEYSHTVQSMGMDRVIFEARELAFEIQLHLAGPGPAADLVRVQHDLDLLSRLSDLQATELEVRSFAPRLNQFVAMCHALKLNFEEKTLRQLISSSVDFYAMALMRNKPMVDNTLALLEGAGAGSVPGDCVITKSFVILRGRKRGSTGISSF